MPLHSSEEYELGFPLSTLYILRTTYAPEGNEITEYEINVNSCTYNVTDQGWKDEKMHTILFVAYEFFSFPILFTQTYWTFRSVKFVTSNRFVKFTPRKLPTVRLSGVTSKMSQTCEVISATAIKSCLLTWHFVQGATTGKIWRSNSKFNPQKQSNCFIEPGEPSQRPFYSRIQVMQRLARQHLA